MDLNKFNMIELPEVLIKENLNFSMGLFFMSGQR